MIRGGRPPIGRRSGGGASSPARPGPLVGISLGPNSPLRARGRTPGELQARLRRRDIEHQEQVRLFEMIDQELGRVAELESVYAIPNETGGRGKATGQRLQREGRRAGVFDVAMDVARPGYTEAGAPAYFNGLRLELKAQWEEMESGRRVVRRGSVSSAQKAWFRRYCREGYAATVCYSAAEAWQLITDYLAGRFVQPARVTPMARS